MQLTVKQVRENVDRMLVRDVFVKLENMTGKRLTVDACCHNDGVTKQCADYCSPAQSSLRADVSGQHVWFHAPFRQIESFVKHYLKCKSRAPQTTSACIVVPACHGKWRKLLSNMTMLQQFEKGSNLFCAPGVDSNQVQLGPAPWAVEVWHDAASPESNLQSLRNESEQLLMTFPGYVQGKPAVTLVDSGASVNFVDRAFAVEHGFGVH